MLAYGINPLIEALNSKYLKLINEVIVNKDTKNKRLKEIIEKVKRNNIRLRLVNKNILNSITKTSSHQDVAFEIERLLFSDIEEVIEKKKNIVLCDSLQDPNNLGSISRNALLFGFDGIVITKDRSVGITPNVIKVSSGAIFHLEIIKVVNLSRTIEFLKSNDYFIIGLESKSEVDISDIRIKFPVGLVVGSEGEGIRELVKKKCNTICKISTTGKLDSLNASVAAAIAMYEMFKKST